MNSKTLQKREWLIKLMMVGLISFSTVKSQTLDTVISFSDKPISESRVVFVKIKPLNTDFTGNIDCLFSLSQDILSAWEGLACGIRFKNISDRDGNTYIEAFNGNGAGYTAGSLEYLLDEPVYLWLYVSVPTQVYSVYATYDSLTAPQMIAELFGFRNTGTSYIDHMGVHVNPAQPEVQNSAAILTCGFVNAVGEFPTEELKQSIYNVPVGKIFFKGIFPNPVVSTSFLEYYLADASEINVDIFNAEGALVKKHYHGFKSSGEQRLTINKKDHVPGVYLYNITTPKTSGLFKIIVE